MNESEKMLEILHKNCKDTKEKMRLRKEENDKKEKRFNKIKIISLAILFVAIIAFYVVYNEKQVNTCISSGKSETFCRYAGE